MEVVSVDQTNRKVESSCKNTQRHLRLAISDWYHLLSRLSLDSDTWLYDCHWWMGWLENSEIKPNCFIRWICHKASHCFTE